MTESHPEQIARLERENCDLDRMAHGLNEKLCEEHKAREKAEASLAEAHLAYAKQSTDVDQLRSDRDRLAAGQAAMVEALNEAARWQGNTRRVVKKRLAAIQVRHRLDPETARIQRIVEAAERETAAEDRQVDGYPYAYDVTVARLKRRKAVRGEKPPQPGIRPQTP